MDKVTKSVLINPDLWQKARGKALSEGMTMQQLIDHLLTEYLESTKKGG
jgi:hypothetical protein